MKYNPKESFSLMKEAVKTGELLEISPENQYIFFTDLGALDKKYRKRVKYILTRTQE